MRKHTQIYLDAFGYEPIENLYIPCEISKNEFNSCLNKATDLHHIQARGMGGSKTKDRVENIMALCRNCHNEYGDITSLISMLYKVHQKRMDIKDVKYDAEYINKQINKYGK